MGADDVPEKMLEQTRRKNIKKKRGKKMVLKKEKDGPELNEPPKDTAIVDTSTNSSNKKLYSAVLKPLEDSSLSQCKETSQDVEKEQDTVIVNTLSDNDSTNST